MYKQWDLKIINLSVEDIIEELPVGTNVVNN